MSRLARRRRAARARGSRGAVLIESALMFPFLALLIGAIIDGGFLLRDSNLAARGVQTGGRVISGAADNRIADFEALRSLDASLDDIDNSTIVKVIIFDAGVSGALDTCKAAPFADTTVAKGVSGVCNIYGPQQIAEQDPTVGFVTSTAAFTTCVNGNWDENWCPTSRVRAGANPDRVGLYVEARYAPVTNLTPLDVTIRRTSVYQLEPCIVGDC